MVDGQDDSAAPIERDPVTASTTGEGEAGGTTSPSQAQPTTATNALPADVQATVEAARRAVEESRKSQEQHLKIIQTLLTEDRPGSKPAAAADEEKIEVDEAVAKYVDRKLGGTIKELEKTYVRDRQQDFEYRGSLEEERAAARFPEFKSIRDEVRAEMQQIDPTLRANPAVWDYAYKAKYGEKVLEKQRQEAARAESVAASARTSGAPMSSLTPEDRAAARRINPTLTDDDIELLSATGPVSLDAYRASKAKRGA